MELESILEARPLPEDTINLLEEARAAVSTEPEKAHALYRQVLATEPIEEAWLWTVVGSQFLSEVPKSQGPLVDLAAKLVTSQSTGPSVYQLSLDVSDRLEGLGIKLPRSLRKWIELRPSDLPGVFLESPFANDVLDWPWTLTRYVQFACNEGEQSFGLYYPIDLGKPPIVITVDRQGAWEPVSSSLEHFLLRAAVDGSLTNAGDGGDGGDAGDEEPSDDSILAVAELHGMDPERIRNLREKCPRRGRNYHRFLLDSVDPNAPSSLLAVGETERALDVFPEYGEALEKHAEELFQSDPSAAFAELVKSFRYPTANGRWSELRLAKDWVDRISSNEADWKAANGDDPLASFLLNTGEPRKGSRTALEGKLLRIVDAYVDRKDWKNAALATEVAYEDGMFSHDITPYAATPEEMRSRVFEALEKAGCGWPKQLALAGAKEREQVAAQAIAFRLEVTVLPAEGPVATAVAKRLRGSVEVASDLQTAMRLAKNGGVVRDSKVESILDLYEAAKTITDVRIAGGSVKVKISGTS